MPCEEGGSDLPQAKNAWGYQKRSKRDASSKSSGGRVAMVSDFQPSWTGREHIPVVLSYPIMETSGN